MPRNRRVFALSAPYVETIHDSFVSAFWPDVEPVGPEEYRDRNLLESAVARPFHTAFGKPVFQSAPEKAAALFHSLIANHPFENGNKRTAVIALDLFLNANSIFLYLGNEQMYQLAKDTASYVARGLTHEQMLARITDAVRGSSMPLADMKDASLSPAAHAVRKIRKAVRGNPHNLASPFNERT